MVMTIPSRTSLPVKREGKRERRRRLIRYSWTYVGLAPFLVIAAFPSYWMLITALKQDQDLYRVTNNPFWFNLPLTFQHVTYLFTNTDFVQWAGNSLFISFFVVVITLGLTIPAAYALTRLRPPGSQLLSITMFTSYLVSPIILFIPLSRVISLLQLQDKIWSLIVTYPSFTIPFCGWLLMGFFKTIPSEIEDAALIDGCGRVRALLHVVLPVTMAGVLTIVIFAFTLVMQEFIYALAFISDNAAKPLPIAVVTVLIRGDVYFWGSLMAAALIGGLPIAILYSFFLDQFVSGITSAAVK
jgi:multiple sugar transport system permease protein